MAIWHLSFIFFSSLGNAKNFAIFIATCYIIHHVISYKRWGYKLIILLLLFKTYYVTNCSKSCHYR